MRRWSWVLAAIFVLSLRGDRGLPEGTERIRARPVRYEVPLSESASVAVRDSLRSKSPQDSALTLRIPRVLSVEVEGERGSRALFEPRWLVPLSLSAADFDEDGRADAVTGFLAPWGGALVVSFGGSLVRETDRLRARAVTISIEPRVLQAGDFDGDGHADIAIADGSAARMVILLGDGRGRFADPQEIALPVVPRVMASAPRVGPPLSPSAQPLIRVPMDLFVIGEAEKRWEIARVRDLSVQERASLPVPAARRVTSAMATDWDDDARADLLILGGDRLLIFSNLARERLAVPNIMSLPISARALAIGDFDGNRRVDLALLEESGLQVTVVWGASVEKTSIALSRAAQTLVAAHLDADRLADLVILATEAAMLEVWHGERLLQEKRPAARSRGGRAPASLVPLTAGCSPVLAGVLPLTEDRVGDLLIVSREMSGRTCPSVFHLATAPANELIVTTTSDDGPGSLRQALQEANASPDPDVIRFRIPTSDPGFTGSTFVIRLRSPLPEIRGGGVTLDGASQIAFTGATNGDRPVIVLSGEVAVSISGLVLASDRNIVRRLILSRFTGADQAAIVVRGGAENVVEGCLIGTNAAGTGPAGNTTGVLLIEDARGNRIGGVSAEARNVISANTIGVLLRGARTTGNLIVGNFIGTATDGETPLSNVDGVRIESEANGNRVGAPGTGNIIAASVGNGVWIRAPESADRNIVQANRIGVSPSGAPIGNRVAGVVISSGNENLIGGTESGEGNLIAHQRGVGVLISGSSRGNRILGNSIWNNGELGIDLRGDGPTVNDPGDADAGPNDLQNFPVIAAAVQRPGRLVLSGRLDARAGDVRIEFFANAACHASGFGEGERFIGAITVRATGDVANPAVFTAVLPVTAIGQFITATATDAAGNTSEFSACAPVNAAPIAEAGPDRVVDEGTEVVLDGTASRDPDGDPLTFRWRQVAGPSVTLSDPTSAQPRFTAPIVDPAVPPPIRLTFELIVSDGRVESDPDLVVITVNRRPIANAGPDQRVDEGTTVTLDGTASRDPDGDPLTFRWRQVAGPSVTLSDATAPRPQFTAPVVAPTVPPPVTVTFELVVSDGRLSSAPDSVVITINRRPIANAGPDQTVPDGVLVTLDGTRSFDPDGDGITFRWTQTAGPTVTLTGATTPRPSFTAPNLAVTEATSVRLTFSLVVSDGRMSSAPDTVDVVVQNLVRLDDSRRSGNRLILNLATNTFEFHAGRLGRTFTGTIVEIARNVGDGAQIRIIGRGPDGLMLTVNIDVRRNVATAVLMTARETLTLFTSDVQ
ncbi:MAG: PKD domain-containing protein [Blastocatellia bacterium]|nr:PKD domain-containing protein [Blastocatellia bacterium]MCS7158341.1 PKD domain-containing protein [Blastocatellia bacterium]MCX7752847.1 PKD domain-containing protein [Blastocatellia bacterium]MDW8167903.1 PKD domain-containing protein [Acidobacteriota bacterium]MDW8255928.1 PKD domain-containing protein [Acidobacteriota bacterium]